MQKTAAMQAGSAGRAAAGHTQRALLAAMGAERCPTLTVPAEAASEGCGVAGGKSSGRPLQHRCGTIPHFTLGHAFAVHGSSCRKATGERSAYDAGQEDERGVLSALHCAMHRMWESICYGQVCTETEERLPQVAARPRA